MSTLPRRDSAGSAGPLWALCPEDQEAVGAKLLARAEEAARTGLAQGPGLQVGRGGGDALFHGFTDLGRRRVGVEGQARTDAKPLKNSVQTWATWPESPGIIRVRRVEGLGIRARQGWLADTSEEFRGLFLPMARWRHFEAGRPVTLAGGEADDIIGLASGVIAFTSDMGHADSPVSHRARGGFWMGYGPILMGAPRVISAEAPSEVWVASFLKARVLPLLEDSTRWWRYFFRLAA